MENILKSLIKLIKVNENTISLLLGVVIVVVVGGMIYNYFQETPADLPVIEDQKINQMLSDNTGTESAILDTNQIAALTTPTVGSDTLTNALPTVKPTNTIAPTNTPRPSNTPVPTNTPRPTNTIVPTNTPKPTNTPTLVPTSIPTNTPMPTQTVKPTSSPSIVATTSAPTPTTKPTITIAPTKAPIPTNTITISPTAAPTGQIASGVSTTAGQGTVASTSTSKHVVVKGDSLWKIAEKYYGSGYGWVEIAKANNLDRNHVGQIEVGQELNIPQLSKEYAKTTTSDSQVANANITITGQTYTIVAGDNLWNIAQRAYGDGFRWSSIADANKDVIKNPRYIEKGMTIKLPR